MWHLTFSNNLFTSLFIFRANYHVKSFVILRSDGMRGHVERQLIIAGHDLQLSVSTVNMKIEEEEEVEVV